MTRRDPLKLVDVVPGMRLSGTVHACANCGTVFIARSDARFCCDACRKASERAAAADQPPAG